jgi:GTP-binding protein EngB required for normal cell division
MRATELPDRLLLTLDELAALATAADHEMLVALRDRLRSARLRVLVVGEAKRGKSTLVNALLSREVLPVGVTPLTAVATTVTHGADEDVEVKFLDGRTDRFPLAALDDLATERGNPANSRAIARITVRLEAAILARGLEIVDTPGTGSVHSHNTAAADSTLPTMDAAVFVLTADPPISASERELLGRVAGLSVTTFVVLNKADYLDAAGLTEAIEFTERVASQAAGKTVRIYSVSARAALAPGGDRGFTEFAADFVAYLETGRSADLHRSAVGQLRGLACSLLDEVALAQRAAQMRSTDAEARVNEFAVRLAAVRECGREAAGVAAADSKRMLTELNAAAECEAARLAAELQSRIGRLLDDELGTAPPAEIERRGRERLSQLTVTAAELWRQAQRERLEDGLRSLDARLTGQLAAELDAVRDAAAELLGLEMVLPSPGGRLAPDGRFFYSVAENLDQAELLAGAVRRRLPGQLGRRLSRDHVLSQVRDLAGRHIGRARADLQYRLAEATRQLILAVGHRSCACTDRLASALETAAVLRAQTVDQAESRLAELGRREQALRGVLARLDAVSQNSEDCDEADAPAGRAQDR